ncbi:hypothetical protein [Myxococcus landrumensis]|uniref:Lipoprotein n=1 Tax=Myxococcus landrumensis TaxID=2813577 RepID=A0ABX7MYH0_9BACT|nr:hypothetical protein [Myxococcus landrumus]QSQ11388.1 hypothetical protein JY572_23585 [Myxococcus landrumus]
MSGPGRLTGLMAGWMLVACGAVAPVDPGGEAEEAPQPLLYCDCPVSYLQGGSRRESSLAPCPPGYCDACGDGRCGPSEDVWTCPPDCSLPSSCGDGVCDAGEVESTCPSDCYCGDHLCNGESVSTCPVDCGCPSQ